MAKSLRTTQLPPIPDGPIDGATLRGILLWWQTEILAKQDIRNDATAFSSGIVATETGVTLGTESRPVSRTGAIPTLFQNISDVGRAKDQRLLHPLNVANLNSAQNSATILTAVSGATTATINVSAHDIKFDYATVPYNSGSVAGLAHSTKYLVYTIDPGPAGGAVSYFATTNPQNVIEQGSYFVGEVTTGIAATAGSVTGATVANPTEITVIGHGWSTGNIVTFANMLGDFAALNNNQYTITVTSVDKFTIPVNTTAFAPYVSGGEATRVVSSPTGGFGGGGGGLWR
jgi:hypothetical protein